MTAALKSLPFFVFLLLAGALGAEKAQSQPWPYDPWRDNRRYERRYYDEPYHRDHYYERRHDYRRPFYRDDCEYQARNCVENCRDVRSRSHRAACTDSCNRQLEYCRRR